MHLEFLYSLLLALALHGSAVGAIPRDAIRLSEVESLTLYADRKTTHRRVPAIPQLRCVSDPRICALFKPDVMRCQNQGAGYNGPEDIQWACKASLPTTLQLGSTEVICEGYSSPNDPYVLRGSCGVEYRLVLTDEGERRHPDLVGGGWGGSGESAGWWGWLFGIIFVCVCLWILAAACTATGNGGGADGGGGFPRRRGWGGGGGGGWYPGGGGGGPGFQDAPPPYPGSKPSGESWRPGFWTGAATGAAAGYMAGRGNQNQNQGGGWFGGRPDYGSNWGSGSRSGGSWGSGSSGSSSRTQRESTGFGSTSRR